MIFDVQLRGSSESETFSHFSSFDLDRICRARMSSERENKAIDIRMSIFIDGVNFRDVPIVGSNWEIWGQKYEKGRKRFWRANNCIGVNGRLQPKGNVCMFFFLPNESMKMRFWQVNPHILC